MRLTLSLLAFLVWPMAEAGRDDNAHDRIVENTPEFATNATTGARLYWETVAEGKVGYYGPYFKAGDISRSGRSYGPNSDIIAVDSALYSHLREMAFGTSPYVVLENSETGEWWAVHAADSGYFQKGYIGDLGDETWEALSGKPLSSGVFKGRLLIGVVR